MLYNFSSFETFSKDFLQNTQNHPYILKIFEIVFPTKKLCLEFIQSLAYCKSSKNFAVLNLKFRIEGTSLEFNIRNNMMITTYQSNPMYFRELEGNNYSFIHHNFKNDLIDIGDEYFSYKYSNEDSKVVSIKLPYFLFKIENNNGNTDEEFTDCNLFNIIFISLIFLNF